MMGSEIVRDYSPAGPTIKAFHESGAFVRGIMGPFSSGKSVACVIEILRRSQMQTPGPDGIRRTRWAVIRNTYGELKTTTLNTWAQWVPREFGKVNMDSPFCHHIQVPGFDMEVLFLALDKEEDTRKLLSLELTGAWINEAREVPKTVLDVLTGRVGRYPAKFQGGGSWCGILMDTNPPDTESWWYKAAELDTPEGWRFFRQPSGLSPEAENIHNMVGGRDYYLRQVPGKSEDFIKVHIEGQYGFIVTGKPVFPMYNDSFHCGSAEVIPQSHFGLILGADFGLTPAAVIAQKLPDGRILIVDELTTDNTGVQRFAELLSSYIALHYPGFNVAGAWGDPAGSYRSSIDERTALQIMNEYTPWKWKPAPGDNSLLERLEVVRVALNRNVDGQPGLRLSPKCKILRKGFSSGYHYKLVRGGDGAQTHETPNKNEFSHPHDALQYLLLGSGEYGVILNKTKRGNRIQRHGSWSRGIFEGRNDISPEKGKHRSWTKKLLD